VFVFFFYAEDGAGNCWLCVWVSCGVEEKWKCLAGHFSIRCVWEEFQSWLGSVWVEVLGGFFLDVGESSQGELEDVFGCR